MPKSDLGKSRHHDAKGTVHKRSIRLRFEAKSAYNYY